MSMTTHSATTSLRGAHVAAGVLVFAIMTLVLAGISEDVVSGRPLTVADVQFSAWLRAHRSPSVTSAMRVVTSLGSTLTVTCVAGVLAVGLVWRQRRPYWFAALVLSVLGGGLLNRLLKEAFHRPRPSFDDPVLIFTGYGFPSGHTMMASVLYGVVAAYLCAHTSDWRRRLLVVASAGLLIALVGFSRIYLGAHYLSDVLAAMAEGLAWLSLCLTAVYSVWLRGTRITRQGL
jgi:membrane-associated phospholipid phosphatase